MSAQFRSRGSARRADVADGCRDEFLAGRGPAAPDPDGAERRSGRGDRDRLLRAVGPDRAPRPLA
eukprot:8460947-Lingulodinium_polyedra.AAC.1